MAEGVPALRIKTAAFGQPRFHLPSQGDVHVVATQQQMISDRHPFELELDGFRFRVDYEPAESTTGMFGGNSNWRGPVWMPLNYLITEALRRFYLCLGENFTVELPTGSGRQVCLAEVADELSNRVVSIFLEAPDGRRP